MLSFEILPDIGRFYGRLFVRLFCGPREPREDPYAGLARLAAWYSARHARDEAAIAALSARLDAVSAHRLLWTVPARDSLLELQIRYLEQRMLRSAAIPPPILLGKDPHP